MAHHSRFREHGADGQRVRPRVLTLRPGRELSPGGQFQGPRYLLCALSRFPRFRPGEGAGEILRAGVTQHARLRRETDLARLATFALGGKMTSVFDGYLVDPK